jgi:hypothetical protein
MRSSANADAPSEQRDRPAAAGKRCSQNNPFRFLSSDSQTTANPSHVRECVTAAGCAGLADASLGWGSPLASPGGGGGLKRVQQEVLVVQRAKAFIRDRKADIKRRQQSLQVAVPCCLPRAPTYAMQPQPKPQRRSVGSAA